MIAAVHRRGVVGVKKSRYIHDSNTILHHRQYIRIYRIPIFELTHFIFICTISKISFKHLFYVDKVYITINKPFMNKKYIENTLMITKEAFNNYILKQQSAQAASFGLTLEQYQQAIINGSVVQSSPRSGSL
jgi:uncharacterized membrane protein (UPF0182 family)